MQLISKFNKGFQSLLCVIDIYSKYPWVVPLKYKKSITITNSFHQILDDSSHKPNKTWVATGSKIYSRSVKPWLQYNDIEMYSTYNQQKSVAAERFIRTSKNETYKCKTSVPKNVYIDILDDIVIK